MMEDKELHESFSSIDLQLQKITGLVTNVDVKQLEIGDDVRKIKEAIYNPDKGLYSRLIMLESWKASISKMIWIIITGVIGLTTAAIWNLVVSK